MNCIISSFTCRALAPYRIPCSTATFHFRLAWFHVCVCLHNASQNYIASLCTTQPSLLALFIIIINFYFLGPKGWPIVGNLYDMLTKMQERPFALELAQKYGPVCKLSVGELFTCHAACVAILLY